MDANGRTLEQEIINHVGELAEHIRANCSRDEIEQLLTEEFSKPGAELSEAFKVRATEIFDEIADARAAGLVNEWQVHLEQKYESLAEQYQNLNEAMEEAFYAALFCYAGFQMLVEEVFQGSGERTEAFLERVRAEVKSHIASSANYQEPVTKHIDDAAASKNRGSVKPGAGVNAGRDTGLKEETTLVETDDGNVLPLEKHIERSNVQRLVDYENRRMGIAPEPRPEVVSQLTTDAQTAALILEGRDADDAPKTKRIAVRGSPGASNPMQSRHATLEVDADMSRGQVYAALETLRKPSWASGR
jgi:hypothetical protein